MNPEFLKVREVAERLRLSAKTVCHYVRIGELPGIFIGNNLRIPREEFDRWLQEKKDISRGISSPKSQ